MREELGKVLIDIAKLVVGGVILAGLMRQDINPILLFTAGSLVAIILICTGLVLITWEKRSKNKK